MPSLDERSPRRLLTSKGKEAVMRRLVVSGVALAALVPLGTAVATSPPDTPPDTDAATSAPGTVPATDAPPASPAPTDTGAPAGTAPEDVAGAAGVATIYDDEGNPIAEITVNGTQLDFTDYAEDNAPDEGNEYVQVMVTVTNLSTEDTFGINVDDFALQDNFGFLTTGENVPTAAQAEAEEEITTEADLESGESLDLTVTFQVDSAAGAQSVFYRPGEEQLVDVVEVA
jgi:Domain of unknown function (DUF4352)